MTQWAWSETVNGDFPRKVTADTMRVSDSGALLFFMQEDILNSEPVLFIASGQWKRAWKED